MARSEESLRRRAEKRQRSVEEQKKVDMQEIRKREKLEMKKKDESTNQEQRFGGSSQSIALRSTSFPPRQPMHTPRNTNDSRPAKKQRHDPETSKTLAWAQQSNDDKLKQNQALRKKYHETNGGEGMDPEELERAKLLIARDERKKQKKVLKKEKKAEDGETKEATEENSNGSANESLDKKTTQAKEEGSSDVTKNEAAKSKTSNNNQNEKKEEHDSNSKKEAKSKRDKNKALRAKYQDTGGKGMNAGDVKRAKKLLERDERKKQNREAALQKQ